MKKTQAIVEWKIPTVPDKKSIEKRSAPLLEQSKNYVIKSEDHFLASWAIIERHDAAIKKVQELFNPFVSGLDKLHKMAVAMRRDFLKPIEDSKAALLGKRQLYRGLQEEAKRKADAEAALLLQKQQQKELEKLAKAEERSGNKQAAAAIREEKAQVPMPFFNSAPAVPQQAGSVVRERWVCEIVDAAAVEREYCCPDMRLIRPVVESLGDKCKISGLRIWKETKEHSRAVSA